MLNSEQTSAVTKILRDEGLPAEQVLRILDKLDEVIIAGAAGGSVSVTQTTDTVEAGATMVGLVIRDL